MREKAALRRHRFQRGEEAQFRRPALLGARLLVSTVGRDEAVIRAYIRNQELEDKRLEQLNLWR
jgi:putative transposase